MWSWITWLSCMPHVELDHVIIVHATCGAGSRDHRACHMWSWITWSSCMPHVELDHVIIVHATCGAGSRDHRACHMWSWIRGRTLWLYPMLGPIWVPVQGSVAQTLTSATDNSEYFTWTDVHWRRLQGDGRPFPLPWHAHKTTRPASTLRGQFFSFFPFFSFSFFFFFFLFFFLTHVRKKKRKKRGKIKRQYEKHLFLSSFLQDGWTSQGPACAYIIIGNNASKKNDQTVTTETDYWIGGCKQEISSSTEW